MNYKIVITALALLLSSAPGLLAQNNEYQLANRLMQQQNYEEALPILESLHENNPSAFIFFDRYVDCLINLQKFETAENVALKQLEEDRSVDETTLKLAEIVHIKGEKERALTKWTDVIELNRNNLQMYYKVASSMLNRREYNSAVEIYRQAQEHFGDDSIFLNELANAYMQAGQFENAVREFYKLIIKSPDQMSLVQQRLLRMRDDNLYQIAAFELEDRLLELDHSHRAYPDLYQLLTWLLLETEEYRRAYTLARLYENETSHTVYALFSLGNQLLSSGEYELAAEAFEFYLNSDSQTVRYRAMEELSSAYIQQAQYLQQNNLETSAFHQKLYEDSYDLNETIIEEWPAYERAERVYSRLIDISLDQFKDADKAESWYEKMTIDHISNDDAFALYAEGRIALFNKNFTSARQALTRADRATDDSNLSEKARYYLSLSDFYAGDFEFAGIQLRSLERRHTSFYANNAIKLRMWIKDGQRADTTGSVLKAIGESMHALHVGNYNQAIEHLEPILANPHSPFSDDLTVELSAELPESYKLLKLKLLERQIGNQPNSPLLERMMWDHATLAEQIYEYGGVNNLPEPPYIFSFSASNQNLSSEDLFFGRTNNQSYDVEYISNLYEEIILKFPDGFYAPYAREKLQSVQLTIQTL